MYIKGLNIKSTPGSEIMDLRSYIFSGFASYLCSKLITCEHWGSTRVWRSIQNVLSGQRKKSGLILEQATGEKSLTFVLSHYPSSHLQICPNSFRAKCYYNGFSGFVLGTENSEIRGYGRWIWRTLFRVVVRVRSSVTEDLVSFRATFRIQMSAHGWQWEGILRHLQDF